jgi:ATP synthase protein I
MSEDKDRSKDGSREGGGNRRAGEAGGSKTPRGEDQGPGLFRGIADLSTIGINLVVATFVGLLIGIYLDRVFGTKPWLTIIFLIFGIIAGFRNIVRLARKHGAFRD